MLNTKKNLDITNLKITGSTPVSEYISNDKDKTVYKNGALQVRGGAYIEKGLKIGNQEQLCNGMLFYDGENFFGHSEKLGTCLLSNHTLSSELSLPLSLFENMVSKPKNQKKYTITAAQNNLTKTSSQELISINDDIDESNNNLEEKLVKNIVVDITMKDISRFYIMIPQVYQNTNFHLNLVITFLFDNPEDPSFINNASVHIINQTNKLLSISCGNDSRYVYYESGFKNEIKEHSIGEFSIERISPLFLTLKSTFYHK